MKTTNLRRNTLRVIIAAAAVTTFLLVSREDYTQEVITEMQNNGAYDALSAQHPEATDSELVKIYTDKK